MKNKILILAFCCCAALVLNAGNAETKKMCWAHVVSWPFPLINGYDKAFEPSNRSQMIPYSDRILAGKYVQEESGIWQGFRKQIESAMQWGIDGFCVDIISDPKEYKSRMSRFYKNAEGLDFKIALCIDNLSGSTDYAAKHLADFILAYKDHPNTCLIDGKMVIFAYSLGGTTSENFQKIRQKLQEKNLDAFFLIQPMRETSMWDDSKRMSNFAKATDGFYDFGCNGFSAEQMKKRLANGRMYMKQENRPNFLCAGIAQGYIGQFTAFYRPFLNTASLRHSWEAAIANNADWVCLTTWNDYVENTHFEPSVNNRSNLVRINREYLYKWRNQTPPARPAQAMLTYMEEAVAGNDITLELLNFSYTTKDSEAVVRVLEKDGKLFREFKSDLNRKDLTAKTFRLTPAELGTRNALRVQFSVAVKGAKHNFRELLPIVRRPDWIRSVRTARASYDDLSSVPVKLTVSGKTAKVSLQTWTWAGKVELLRNNWPIKETEINHTKKPFANVTFTLDNDAFPEDHYYVRITDASDRVGYSNPAFKVNSTLTGAVSQPVIVTNCDFDESWPLWTVCPRKYTAAVSTMTFRQMDMFNVRFNMDKAVDTKMFFSDSHWNIAAIAGKNPNVYWGNNIKYAPKAVTLPGPDGKERTVWSFDGDDNVTWTSRAFPHGPMTIETWVRPAGGAGVLFSTSGTSLTMDDKMTVKFTRNPEGKSPSALLASQALQAGKWTHIAAVYSGNSLELFFDGKSVGKVPAKPIVYGVNAIPVIGNIQQRTSGGFKGDMAGFALYGGTPQNGKFLLK